MKNLIEKLLFLYLFAASLGVQGQNSNFSGRVVSGGEALGYASVFVQKVNTGATADSAGLFFLKNIPAGKHTLRVSNLGHRTAFFEVEFSAEKPSLGDFKLLPDETALGQVVVTGTMKEMRKADSPVPVEIYSPKFFQKNPSPSLFDAVGMVNGVRPQLQCSVCNTGDIHINGMEGPYTMVLIDGMPIVSGLSTVYGLHGIPASMIHRLEVVKGPAASLYGSEAMGGIINVITKDPANAPRLSADLLSTSHGEHNFDLAGAYRRGKWSGMLSGNVFNFQQRRDVNADNFTDVTLQKRISVFKKISLERPENRAMSLAFRYLWEDRFGGELDWTPAWRGSDSIYGESILTRRWELLGQYQLPMREKMTLSFSANEHLQDSYYGKVPYRAEQRIVFGQLIWDKKIAARHDGLFGAAFRQTWYDDNTPVTAAPDATNAPQITPLPGLFVQDEWTPNSRWKALAGLRLDWHRQHGSILSPRLNLKYNPNKINTLRFSVGNGFRVVNVFSEDHAALTGGRSVVFREALEPERSWNANLNFTRFQNARFGFVTLDATVFYTYYYNKIVGDYTSDPELVIYENLRGHAEGLGFSLNSDWAFLTGTKLTAGLTVVDVRTVENGRREQQILTPQATGNWSLTHTFERLKLSLDYNGTVTGPMLLPVFPDDYRPERSPWFSIQNLQITKQLGKMELYGGVKNLLNFYPREDVIMRPFDPFDKQVDDPVTNPKGFTFDPSYIYAPVQGRRVFVGVRVRW